MHTVVAGHTTGLQRSAAITRDLRDGIRVALAGNKMKEHASTTTEPNIDPHRHDEIDSKEIERVTGGYRTDGVDSVDYQTWYFTKGPGAAR